MEFIIQLYLNHCCVPLQSYCSEDPDVYEYSRRRTCRV